MHPRLCCVSTLATVLLPRLLHSQPIFLLRLLHIYPCMAKHAAQRHQGANRRTAGDDGRHTTQRTHITLHILISYSPYGTACFLCTLHQFNGIFTLACSPTDANRSNGQRNQPEPSALLPARSSELLAGCDGILSTHITHTSHASRLLSSSLSQHLLPPRSRN